MKISILTVTKNGAEVGKRIVQVLEGVETELYVNKRFQLKGAKPMELPLGKLVGRLFSNRDALIFVASTGVAVRSIAEQVKDKATDPAVVVVDEAGKHVISLLSGHLGGANELTKRVAEGIGAAPVITTATEVQGKVCVEGLAKDLGLEISQLEACKAVNASIVNGERVCLFSDLDISSKRPPNLSLYPLDELDGKARDFDALIIISNKRIQEPLAPHVILRPKNLVVGVGCKRGASKEDVLEAITLALDSANLSKESVRLLATVDFKGLEGGIIGAAEELGVPLKLIGVGKIKEVESGFRCSAFVRKNVGVGAVAEPVAVLASDKGRLLQRKVGRDGVTVAVAEDVSESKGRIVLVGLGPGNNEHMTAHAKSAIDGADVIVSYKGYLNLIKALIKDKEVLSSDMTEEVKRASMAVKGALEGKEVALVCSGDPGVYAMASIIYEILSERELVLDVEVVPGVTSATASAALLGAPLSNDFAVISLSDLLTPWEIIEKRLINAAESDFVIVLYNPKSKRRTWQINRATEMLLRYRKPDTPVGIVRNAMRRGESIKITTLKELAEQDVDMMTTVVIGNSQTFMYNDWMITSRGYKEKYDLRDER